jgi:hypothetical protein
MANPTSVLVQQPVVGLALGHRGVRPGRHRRRARRACWNAIRLSPNRRWRVLRRHGPSTRSKREGLVAGYAAPPAPERPAPPPERHLNVDHPGAGLLCIGRLSGTKGTLWQYTAIDVASAYTWASLHLTRRNPSATWTSLLARTVTPISPAAAGGWSG